MNRVQDRLSNVFSQIYCKTLAITLYQENANVFTNKLSKSRKF